MAENIQYNRASFTVLTFSFDLIYKKHLINNFFLTPQANFNITNISFNAQNKADTIYSVVYKNFNPAIGLEYVYRAKPKTKYFVGANIFYHNHVSTREKKKITYGLGTYTTDPMSGQMTENTATDVFDLDNHFIGAIYQETPELFFYKFNAGVRHQGRFFFELSSNFYLNYYDFLLMDKLINFGFSMSVGKIF